MPTRLLFSEFFLVPDNNGYILLESRQTAGFYHVYWQNGKEHVRVYDNIMQCVLLEYSKKYSTKYCRTKHKGHQTWRQP